MPEETPAVEAPASAAPATPETTAPAAAGIEAFPTEAQDLIRSLRQEAASYRTKYQEAKPLAEKAKELEDAGKTELQRITEELTQYRTRATQLEAENLRSQVAAAKGLTPAQAKRLAGTTEEELMADADELITTFGATSETRPPIGRPTENLRGGSNPEAVPEELDPTKLAAKVRRSFF